MDDDEADEDPNNRHRECRCRCNCRKCSFYPFYNDINNDLQYLSVFLTQNHCQTECTNGNDVDFGEWIPYCC